MKKSPFAPCEMDGSFTTANVVAKMLKYHDLANLFSFAASQMHIHTDTHTYSCMHKHTILPWVMSTGLEWSENQPGALCVLEMERKEADRKRQTSKCGQI